MLMKPAAAEATTYSKTIGGGVGSISSTLRSLLLTQKISLELQRTRTSKIASRLKQVALVNLIDEITSLRDTRAG